MSAIFSPCRTWRYVLVRETERGVDMRMANEFHKGKPLPIPTVAFIGLNPSTADEVVNDATVRVCMGFADRWGYGRMVMLNVFAFRAKNPKRLFTPDPIGPLNDDYLVGQAQHADRVIACWGVYGALPGRNGRRCDEVVGMLREAGVKLHVIGLTKDGHPRHPLYQRRDLTPVPWEA